MTSDFCTTPICLHGSYAAEYDDVVADEDEHLNRNDGVQRCFPESEGAEFEERACNLDADLGDFCHPEQSPGEVKLHYNHSPAARNVVGMMAQSIR